MTDGRELGARGRPTGAGACCSSSRRRPGPEKRPSSSALVQTVPDLAMSRSYTSRPARPGKTHGIDYNFITRARFEEMIAADAFLEWADVFGNLYGTSAADAERTLSAGRDLVLVIDVQGARQVRHALRRTVGVFVLPPSFEILERRLRGRSADSEAAMQRRLQTARDEVAAFAEYDYVVVNDEIEACVDRIRGDRAGRAGAAALRPARRRGDREHVRQAVAGEDRSHDRYRERRKQVRVRDRGRRPGAAAAARLHAEDRGSDKPVRLAQREVKEGKVAKMVRIAIVSRLSDLGLRSDPWPSSHSASPAESARTRPSRSRAGCRSAGTTWPRS